MRNGFPRRVAALFPTSILALLIASCSSGGGTGGGGGGTPSIALSLSPTSGTVAQNGSILVTGTLVRGGGFTGAVTINVTGGPADGSVTGTTGTPMTSGDTTQVIVTIEAGDSADPGSYQLTVHATATGVAEATAKFQLTVSAGAGYALSNYPGAITVSQGATGSDTVIITRPGYNGAVALSLDGAPTGVTAAFAPASMTSESGISSTLTLTVASTTVPGTYPLTIRGQASGRSDQTASLTLTVTAGTSFGMSASSAAVSVVQGGSAVDTIRVTRAGFTGTIGMSTRDAPTGLTVTFNPADVIDSVTVATVNASSSVPAGTDTITIVATPSGNLRGAHLASEVTIPLIVTVAPQSISGELTFDWSGCAAANTPIWVGVQDGTGAWTHLTPASGSTYTANWTQPKGGLAYVVTDGANDVSLNVQYFVVNGHQATTPFCAATSSRTASVTVAGLTTGEFAYLSLGGSGAFASMNGNVQFNSVADGMVDLIGYKQHVPGALGVNDRFYQWGGLNPAAGASLGTTDVTTWAMPSTATMTVSGVGTDFVSHANYFLSANCAESYLYGGISVSGSSFVAYGAPESHRAAGQGHRVAVSAVTNGGANTGQRYLYQDMGALAPMTLMLPSAYPLPTITSQSGTVARPLFTAMQPSDLTGGTYLSYTSTTSPYLTTTISGSIGYNGSPSIAWSVPDLTGVAGFNASWQLSNGAHFSWFLGGYNTGYLSLGGGAGSCGSGNRAVYSTISGSF